MGDAMESYHFLTTANPQTMAPRANPEFSGVVTIPAGTIAAPSLTYAGDSDTGLCRPAPDSLALVTGGVQCLRATAQGHVVVGPDNGAPVARLSLGSGSAVDRLHLFDDGSNRYGFGVTGTQMQIYGAPGATVAVGQRNSATGSFESEALRVIPMIGGVNRLEITGAPSGWAPTIGTQGADADIPLLIHSKGAGVSSYIGLNVRGQRCLTLFAYSGTSINYLRAASNSAGNPPELSAFGGDDNIDLALTPKGTGLLRFGTWSACSDQPVTGWIAIRDASGALRKIPTIS